LLENTPWFILLYALAIAIAVCRVRPDRFRRIAWWQFGLGAAQFWGSLAGLLLAFAWSRY
jgi:hypothetical protein